VAAALTAPAAAHAQATVTDGETRFQVLTPSLVRVEYAADRRFEDRPTLNAIGRERRAPRVRVTRTAETLRIRTSRMTVRYRRGSGPFGGGNLVLALRVGRSVVTASPEFPPAPPPGAGPPSTEVQPYTVREDPDYAPRTEGNLGGWYRALDLAGGPVGLHDGLLSRDGWYLLDDTRTFLLSGEPPGFAVRPEREGAYQDGYLFAYGRDYARGLADLRALTGAAPLLPRSAFGVWFSRYFAYRQSDYAPLLARFRAENVPLDVLMVDTDFKAPHAWNGWSWLPELFPDPRAFFAWAQSEGIDVGLNTHPSIATDDPRLAEAERRAGRPLPADPTGARCRTFVAIGDSYGRGTPGRSTAASSTGRAPATRTPTSGSTSRSSARAPTSGGSTTAATSPTRSRRGSRRTPGSTTSTPSARGRAAAAGRCSRGSARRCSTPTRREPGSGPSTATRSTSPATRARRGRCSTSRPR
jgi:hypothetical protein